MTPVTPTTPDPCPAIPRVLTIAGTDPTGGAGSQADVKTIHALGGFALAVTTAVLAQNTQGVRSIVPLGQESLAAQLSAVIDDVTIDAVKIGMLGDVDTIRTVRGFLESLDDSVSIVIDPVMVATSGDRLIDADAEQALVELMSLADVITPNIPELAVLTGVESINSRDEAIARATALAEKIDAAVIVKGGHLSDDDAGNNLVTACGPQVHVSSRRIDTTNTHGTGCSLSSALATRCGAGDSFWVALKRSTVWLSEAIAAGAQLHVGHGHGPVDHHRQLRRWAIAADTQPWQQATGASVGAATTANNLVEPSPIAAPTPALAPPGPFTAALWNATGNLWRDTMDLPFIQDLRAGTLSEDRFAFYLDQDAHYLTAYGRALGALGVTAPTTEDAAAWSTDSAGATQAEMQMHTTWLADRPRSAAASPVTAAYTNFLLATTLSSDYVVGAAAVLPCYWLYLEIGIALSDRDISSHPYRMWLEEYSSEEFHTTVTNALERVERAFAAASPAQRQQAVRAYLTACRHEYEFFDQADRRVFFTR